MDISILIVTKKWDPTVHQFHYIKDLKHSNIDFEILIAEGFNPSVQRNLLAQKARGNYLLFLDDDSIPAPELLEQYFLSLKHFPNAKIIGGPSLLLPLEKSPVLFPLLELFFSSRLGIGPIKCRYNSLGPFKAASEQDLILCNMLIKRDFFLKTKGFAQEYYPGEENHFIKNLDDKASIYYDPNAIVYRKPREDVSAFFSQMVSYGKGRAKHLSLRHRGDFYYLIPVAFLFYLLSLLFIGGPVVIIPLVFYVSSALFISLKSKKGPGGLIHLLSPFIFLLGHVGYALGICSGLLKYKVLRQNKKKSAEAIAIHQIKNFKKCYT